MDCVRLLCSYERRRKHFSAMRGVPCGLLFRRGSLVPFDSDYSDGGGAHLSFSCECILAAEDGCRY